MYFGSLPFLDINLLIQYTGLQTYIFMIYISVQLTQSKTSLKIQQNDLKRGIVFDEGYYGNVRWKVSEKVVSKEMWFLIRLVLSVWSFIRVVSQQGGLLLIRWSLIKMISGHGGLSSVWCQIH